MKRKEVYQPPELEELLQTRNQSLLLSLSGEAGWEEWGDADSSLNDWGSGGSSADGWGSSGSSVNGWGGSGSSVNGWGNGGGL